MKRTLALVCAAVIMLAGLSGCKSDGQKTGGQLQTPDGQPVSQIEAVTGVHEGAPDLTLGKEKLIAQEGLEKNAVFSGNVEIYYAKQGVVIGGFQFEPPGYSFKGDACSAVTYRLEASEDTEKAYAYFQSEFNSKYGESKQGVRECWYFAGADAEGYTISLQIVEGEVSMLVLMVNTGWTE